METKKNQRIIGGLVIVALIAIFLPLFFHHARPLMNVQLSANMPNPPTKPTIQLELPQQNPSESAASNNDEPIDLAAENNLKMAESAKKTAAISQKILNTTPAAAALMNMPPNALAEVQKVAQTAFHREKGASFHSAPHALASAEAPSSKTKPVFSPLATPSAWVLQVASYTDPNHAEHLLKSLRAGGFDAYVKQASVDGKSLTRVYVGPDINKERLQGVQQALQDKLHLRSVLQTYTARQ